MGRLTGADLFVNCVKAEGVDTIFTVVGDQILALVDAVAEAGIRIVDTRHESSAVHAADAYARVSGRPGMVWTTGGPGLANSIAGLTVASVNESPVIHVAGSGAIKERGMMSFQEIPQLDMVRPVTKSALEIYDARRIPEVIGNSLRAAVGGRPGPVHISFPTDLQEQQIEESDVAPYRPAMTRTQGKARGDASLIQAAVAALRNAKRPAIILGAAARYGLDPTVLREFAETTRVPVFTTESARGMLDDRHPYCFGYAERGLNDAARLYGKADVVLIAGKRFDLQLGYARPPVIAADATVIQVEPDPNFIGRNRDVQIGILADIGGAFEQLLKEARGLLWREQADWLAELRAVRKQQAEKLFALGNDEMPLHPMRVAKELVRYNDENTVISIDGGDFIAWSRAALHARTPGSWLRLGNLGHLGCGLPNAIGAKVARPDARVIHLTGDGSIGFYFMEYDTAIRHNIPFVTVMGNDAQWGIDRGFQLAYYGRAVATDLRWVRYDQAVQAIGGYGELVESPADLGPAIDRAFASGKPALVNVRTQWAQSPFAQGYVARHKAEHAARGQGR